jgi:hypothetical protein
MWVLSVVHKVVDQYCRNNACGNAYQDVVSSIDLVPALPTWWGVQTMRTPVGNDVVVAAICPGQVLATSEVVPHKRVIAHGAVAKVRRLIGSSLGAQLWFVWTLDSMGVDSAWLWPALVAVLWATLTIILATPGLRIGRKAASEQYGCNDGDESLVHD